MDEGAACANPNGFAACLTLHLPTMDDEPEILPFVVGCWLLHCREDTDEE